MSDIIARTPDNGREPDDTPFECDIYGCISHDYYVDDEPVHRAAYAVHGDVEVEVFLQVENGLWKQDICARFDYRNQGVTYEEAKALAADIARHAEIVSRLNLMTIIGKHVGRPPGDTTTEDLCRTAIELGISYVDLGTNPGFTRED